MGLERLNEERIEKAFAYLAETDLEAAACKGAELRAEMKAKSVEATVYAALQGSIEDKKMQVRVHPDVQEAWDEYFDAVVKHQTLRNRRDREVLIVETYRSVLSARKQGMMV